MLTGRCPAYGEGITFWPLREVVVQARGDRSADELAAALEIPVVAVRRVAAAVGLEEGEPGEDTDWAFLQLIGALARVGPLVIVVDDAHWAEPALLDLLLDLVARLRDAPLLVVWVARPDLLDAGAPARAPPLCCSRCRRGERGAARGGRRRQAGAGRGAPDHRGGGRQPAVPRAARRLRRRAARRRRAPPGAAGPAGGAARPARRAERAALALAAVAGDPFDAGAMHALATGSRSRTSSAPASGSSSATCSSASRLGRCASATR